MTNKQDQIQKDHSQEAKIKSLRENLKTKIKEDSKSPIKIEDLDKLEKDFQRLFNEYKTDEEKILQLKNKSYSLNENIFNMIKASEDQKAIYFETIETKEIFQNIDEDFLFEIFKNKIENKEYSKSEIDKIFNIFNEGLENHKEFILLRDQLKLKSNKIKELSDKFPLFSKIITGTKEEEEAKIELFDKFIDLLFKAKDQELETMKFIIYSSKFPSLIIIKKWLEFIKNNQDSKEIAIETKQFFGNFQPIKISKAIAFIDKLSNNLYLLENNQTLEIGKQGGKKKNLQNSVIKVMIENGTMGTSKIIEPFDKVVLNSIYSVIQKNQCFDIQMLKETMTQNKNRHKGKLDEEIEASILKLRTTLIQIEVPEELQNTFKNRFERVGIKDCMLPLRELYVVKGGHEKSVFKFTSNSLYFEYAEAKGQLISKEIKMLHGGIGNATKESCILTNEISTRIQDMKTQKKNNKDHSYIKQIKIEPLFDLIIDKNKEIREDSLRQKKVRTKNLIITILEDYKKNKFINEFNQYEKGFEVDI